ncbi:BREX-1 system adenine-specific DNA-methyltransferase PglX [Algoriphagus formosus]|uniref:BREX-1 system adenine-specific DNA-methyltransferase PglX n=1 Tax=Algoriphagus formosus TaxID=2007308 RepID=UPI000C28A7CD|nr:BREX-1 system adenine-specific DNA-methyltransferase PglX [Algoriphagus formosus]
MNLKTFSQQARRILLQGVAQKLLFWGFDPKGNVLDEPQAVEGGYFLRGESYDDPTVPGKWKALKEAVSRKGIETVVEEAAYTWFNRIMAIRILAKNGYDRPQLEYEGESKTPTLLARARRGQLDFLSTAEKNRLQKTLTDYSKDKESFAILLCGYCEHHELLSAVFGRLDDYTELLLPDDILEEGGLIQLLNTTDAISDEDYRKVELIGWLYQFYISEKKDEVFASFKKNKKAEAKDIPAATQIFTPNWIVKYMVQNTAGKLWLDLNPDSAIRGEMKYLIDDPEQKQPPIISEAAQLKLLDPAVGSGHILVEGFDLLYAMYQEEYYTPEDAVQAILSQNLFGLDIDTRAVQLARFALLLKAAKYYPEVLKKGWMPRIYAMPEPYFFTRQEILDFLGREGLDYEEELTDALKLMRDAQNLGSTMIIDLNKEGRKFLIQRIQELEKLAQTDLGLQSVLNRIRPYIQVMAVLTDQYEAVAANPPYMGSGNMNGTLSSYVAKFYPEAKSDLMTVFMEVIPAIVKESGKFAMINLPSWLFLSSFEKLRKSYISKYQFDSLLHMGRGIFGIDFGSVTFSIAKRKNPEAKGTYFRLHERNFQHIYYEDIEKLFLYSKGNVGYRYDFGQYRGEEGITEIPEKGTPTGIRLYYPQIFQTNFSKIPGNPIAYWVSQNIIDIYSECDNAESKYFRITKGVFTGDNSRFLRIWHEVGKKHKYWKKYDKAGGQRKWFGLANHVINWKNEGSELKSFSGSGLGAMKFFSKPHLVWSGLGSGDPTFRISDEFVWFDDVSPAIVDPKISSSDVGFFNSTVSRFFLKLTNPTLHYQIGDVKKVPVKNFSNSSEIQKLSQSAIQIGKSDWNSRETSWDFEGSPLIRERNLKSAYQAWEEKVTADFFALHRNEEELNRIFIEIYGLEEELTPEVPLTEITILQEELDEKKLQKLEDRRLETEDLRSLKLPIKRDVVMKQLISYLIGVSMGRYRLDLPGLHIAHPDPTPEELASYTFDGYRIEIDEDAIIPIMGSASTFADDALQRVKYFLEVIWGADTLTQNLNFLQECLDEDLESYLVKKFWADHCKTYKKKPIYWLFSSEKGAFQVLTYMHRMNAFTVEKIRSNYLMPHLKHLRTQIDRLESSKEDPRTLDRLQKALTECEAYDLQLKDVADKQISFDLDDGVKKNYELFEGVVKKVK